MILKLNHTRLPILQLEDFAILILKQPSPVTNPAIQLGLLTETTGTIGLKTGVASGKTVCKFSLKTPPLIHGCFNTDNFSKTFHSKVFLTIH